MADPKTDAESESMTEAFAAKSEAMVEAKRPNTKASEEAMAPELNDAGAPPAPGAENAADIYNQLLRLKAEFENFRKRVDRERPEWIKTGEVGLLRRFIPLYDVLLQAHDQVLKASLDEDAASKELVKGLDLIFKEFTKIFDNAGVKVIESVGKPYHHDLHEALGAVETDEHPEGTVLEELQRGYTFQGKVLCPARVRIAKPKTAAS